MRPDQIDAEHKAMSSRPDGWNPEGSGAEDRSGELHERASRASSPVEEVGGVSWQDIKSRFVDDPEGAIGAAEELLQGMVEQKVRALKAEADAICAREHDEDESSTETLRTRLIRYQAYCERLASTSAH